MYARNQRQTFTSLRRVMAARRNAVVDLTPVPSHMLIQQIFNGANSSLYQADANGRNLTRISYGRGHFYFDGEYTHDAYRNSPEYTLGPVVAIDRQVLMPWKPVQQSRELLIARDLDGATTSIRQRWNDTNESGFRGSYMTTGPNNTAYFCAANGAGSRWLGGLYYERNPARFKPRLWITDGSSDNTRPIISDIGGFDNSRTIYRYGPCGQFTISGDRIFYTRNTKALGREIWTANLDGSDQKLLVDLQPGEASSWRYLFRIDTHSTGSHENYLKSTKMVITKFSLKEAISKFWRRPGIGSGSTPSAAIESGRSGSPMAPLLARATLWPTSGAQRLPN